MNDKSLFLGNGWKQNSSNNLFQYQLVKFLKIENPYHQWLMKLSSFNWKILKLKLEKSMSF